MEKGTYKRSLRCLEINHSDGSIKSSVLPIEDGPIPQNNRIKHAGHTFTIIDSAFDDYTEENRLVYLNIYTEEDKKKLFSLLK